MSNPKPQWDGTQNEVSEISGNVVQAREIHGDLHIHHGSAGALPVPRQLPADTAAFVGRETDLADLDALLASDDGARAVVISALAGGAGVGKTTLAVRWAHRVRERFPDGDLFVNLRGYDPGQPVTPGQALEGFLRALDVPAEKISVELATRAALFRSLLAGRRMLVILDNAASAEQVRPLLPGSAGCLTLITSRSRLSGLTAREGASRVPIDVLSLEDAMKLFRQVIGEARVDAELETAADLARRCGYLPLALRIAADRAATHPHLRLADLVEELADERDRLDTLASDDDEMTAVRAVFSWSYEKLPPDAARVFRLLGLHTGPEVSSEAAAALAGLPTTRIRRLLDTLTGQHLLEQIGRNRYRFHDLLRTYAAERAAHDEPETARVAAVSRLLGWYLHTTRAARHILVPNTAEVAIEPVVPAHPPPTFSTYEEALSWCEQERTNLVSMVHLAAEVGHDVAAWQLTYVLTSFLWLRWYMDDWLATLLVGLAAARRIEDLNAQAQLLIDLGERACALGRLDEAVDYFEQALPLSRQGGSQGTEGFCLNGLGAAYSGLGRFEEALDHLYQALAIFSDIRARRGEGIALCNLGEAWRGLGRSADAIRCQREAAAILEEIGNHEGRATALRGLGDVYRDQRRLDDAARSYHEALKIFRAQGHRREIGVTLVGLGVAQLASGQTEAAVRSWQESLAIFRDLGEPQAREIQARLAAIPHGSLDV